MEKVMQLRKEELIHIVHEINRELLMGEAGWRMDKCADMIESYVAERVASHLRVNQALVDGCNRMIRRGSKGTTADLEEYVAIREAALVERIEREAIERLGAVHGDRVREAIEFARRKG